MSMKVKNIKINGKEYNMLMPRAVDLMRAEDACLGDDGELNIYAYQKEMLKLVDKKLNINTLVESKNTIVQNFDLSCVTYEEFLSLIPVTKNPQRVRTVENLIKILELKNKDENNRIDIGTFSREQIEEIYMAVVDLYDTHLFEVVDEIYTFCV